MTDKMFHLVTKEDDVGSSRVIQSHKRSSSYLQSSCSSTNEVDNRWRSVISGKGKNRSVIKHMEAARPAEASTEKKPVVKLSAGYLGKSDRIQSLQLGHARNISKTETEKSYHTANGTSLPPSPGVPEGKEIADKKEHEIDEHNKNLCLEEQMRQTILSKSNEEPAQSTKFTVCRLGQVETFDGEKGGSSTVSTLTTNVSGLSMEDDVQASSQSSPLMCIREVAVQNGEDEIDSNFVKVQSADCHLAEISAIPSSTNLVTNSLAHKNDQSTFIYSALGQLDAAAAAAASPSDTSSERVETSEEKLLRLQRTLDWRLLSASSTSPTSHFPLSPPLFVDPNLKADLVPPEQLHYSSHPSTSWFQPDNSIPRRLSIRRAEVAIQQRRNQHQQRDNGFRWVNLLPSFEEVHPRRSQEREVLLRRLAWVGLEEYVARRLRTSNGDGTIGKAESIVWITHSCFGRNTKPYKTKASQIEPLLCSSSLFLRGSDLWHANQAQDKRKCEDAIQAYRAYLMQNKLQPISSIPLRLSGQMKRRIENPLLASNVDDLSISSTLSPLPIPGQSDILSPKDEVDIDILTSENLGREESLELQRSIEACMYQLRCSNDKWCSDSIWLQSLQSIESGEKEAIECFFHTSSTNWYESTEGNLGGAEPDYVRRMQNDGFNFSEFSWPETSCSPMALPNIDPSCVGYEEDGLSHNGLSSHEMAEIEEAMYRDYLQQSNQSAPPRHRKKERTGAPSHNKAGSNTYSAVAGRGNRGSSLTVRSTSYPADGPAATPSLQSRHSEAHCPPNLSKSTIAVSVAPPPIEERRTRNNTATRSDVKSIPSQEQSPRCKKSEVDQRSDLPRPPVHGMLPHKILIDHSRGSTKGREEYIKESSYDSWAKETEDRAVRHSLANLQEHLSLVAAQKTIQAGALNSDDVSLYQDKRAQHNNGGFNTQLHSYSIAKPNLPTPHHLESHRQQQQGHHPQPMQTSQTRQCDTSEWPTYPEVSTSNQGLQLQAQLALQAQWHKQQRQQQRPGEANYLEQQRYIDSYLQAMDRSPTYPHQYFASSDEQSQDIARLHAALISEWARHGGDRINQASPYHHHHQDWYTYPERHLVQEEQQRRQLHQNHQINQRNAFPPTITLTESTPKRHFDIPAQCGQPRSDTTHSSSSNAWKRSQSNQSIEDAINHRAQYSWQATNNAAVAAASAAAAAAVTSANSSSVGQKPNWDHPIDALPPIDTSSPFRRHSIQTSTAQGSVDSDLVSSPFPEAATLSSLNSAARRNYVAINRPSRRGGGHGTGLRRKGKQRGDDVRPFQQQHIPQQSTIPTMPSGDRERAQRQQPRSGIHTGATQAHSYDDDVLRGSQSHNGGKVIRGSAGSRRTGRY